MHVYTVDVIGSIPVGPTKFPSPPFWINPRNGGLFRGLPGVSRSLVFFPAVG